MTHPELTKKLNSFETDEHWKKGIRILENKLQPTMKKPPNSTGAFKPTPKQLEKLRTVSTDTKGVLEHLSPFLYNQKNDAGLTVYTDMDSLKIFPYLLPFKQSDVKSMSNETKEELLEAILEGVSNTLRDEKEVLFPANTYFESTFQKERLRILLEEGDDPVILPEEDFVKIESILLDVIRKEMSFRLNLQPERGFLKIWDAGWIPETHFKFDLILEMMKHFPYVDSSYQQDLYYAYMESFEENYAVTYEDVNNYRQLPTHLFSHHLELQLQRKTLRLTGWITEFHLNFQNLESIFLMVSPNEMVEYAERLVSVYEEISEFLQFEEEEMHDLSRHNAERLKLMMDKRKTLSEMVTSSLRILSEEESASQPETNGQGELT